MRKTKSKISRWLLICLVLGACSSAGLAQTGSVLYGDFLVEEDEAGEMKPVSYNILLYTMTGFVIARQTVSSHSSYRMINLADGDYDLVVELESIEVARIRVRIRNPVYKTDMRQDITLGWKSINSVRSRPASVTAEDYYKRTPANKKLFERADEAIDKKKYPDAQTLLKQLLTNDPGDFQAWTELGTAFLLQDNGADAEKAYKHSLEIRPKFFLALMNLGRLYLLQRRFDAAIPVLTRAVEVKSTSPEANYYLGEAYLQIKRGSKAVGYLYEALKLDPLGKAEAHLRLAALYNGAGLKKKAALEYAEFLKKKPDYPDKKKLEQYISQNRKP